MTEDAERGGEGRRGARGWRALGQLRPRTARRRAEERQALCEAVLILAGERGLRQVSMAELLGRARLSRLAFHSHFDDLAECFAAAHELELERFADAVLAAGSEAGEWPHGYRRALECAAAKLGQRPLLYRGLLCEGRTAGAAVAAERETVAARLQAAIDTARLSSPLAELPPPLSATFVLAAAEQTATAALAEGSPERFTATVPKLARLAAILYFGDGDGRRRPSPG